MSDILKAEVAINKILADMEEKTGEVVESISLHNIDATSMGDDRQKFITTVRIETYRLPGKSWNT